MSGEVQVAGPNSASGRVKVATVDVSEDWKTITFNFAKAGVGPIEFSVDQLPGDIQARGLAHGIVQKVRDTYAGVKGDVDMAFANAKETVDHLLAGDWSVRGESDGVGGQGALYIEALSRLGGMSLEETRARVAGMPEEWKKGAQKDPDVVVVINQIKLERAQAAVEAAKAKQSAGGEGSVNKISLSDLFKQAAEQPAA